MTSVFCNCDLCGREIFVGEQMYSLTLSKDDIIDDMIVQPLEANSVQSWCETCGPKAVEGMAAKIKSMPQ